MLTADRALGLSWKAGPELPRISALAGLYQHGVKFRQGETMMIVGRPGSQKSGFALWLAVQWNLPTLYLSADMSSFTASTRIAEMKLGMTEEQIQALMQTPEGYERVMNSLRNVQITFSHDNPITWRSFQDDLDAYVELWDMYPQIIVVDNLMDMEDCDTDFAMQQKAMQELVAISRKTGSTVVVLHHAQENSSTNVEMPPSRGEVQNKMTQKPELVLSVAISPDTGLFRVACIKARMGKSDPSAKSYTTLTAYADTTRFGPWRP